MKTIAAIPCYNEALAIGSVVLKARKYVDEVLVVDDGSTDDTVEVATAAGAVVVSYEENKGKGAAIKTALKYAATEGKFGALVLLDGDGQHDPNQIPQLIQLLQDDTADVVIGFRNLNQMPRYRRLGRVVLDITTAAGRLTRDSQSGFRALNRKAVEALQSENLKSDGFSIESEMILAARDRKLRINDVPIHCNYGNGKTSTKDPVSHGVGVLGSIIQVIAEKRPLRYIGGPGFVLCLVGVLLGIRLLQVYNQTKFFSLAYAMLVAIFLILGALGLFMGLMLNAISRLRARDGDHK